MLVISLPANRNMKIKILCFGITRDIIGQFEYTTSLEDAATIADLKQHLSTNFPTFATLKSLRVAINSEYAEDAAILKENDEIVLIPPVSGG
jgi:molybdopterin synthase sulfur carrier subunit